MKRKIKYLKIASSAHWWKTQLQYISRFVEGKNYLENAPNENWELRGAAKKVNIFVIFSGNNLCNFEIGAAEAAVMAELLQFHHAIASLHPSYASWSSN